MNSEISNRNDLIHTNTHTHTPTPTPTHKDTRCKGKEDSPPHSAALRAVDRGKRLRSSTQQLLLRGYRVNGREALIHKQKAHTQVKNKHPGI